MLTEMRLDVKLNGADLLYLQISLKQLFIFSEIVQLLPLMIINFDLTSS